MSKKKGNGKHVAFGEDLMKSLIASFDAAYHLHVAHGESIDAILIRYDIAAAADDCHPVVADAHRAAIKSAVEAADAGIPRLPARIELLRRFVGALLKFQ